MNKKNSQPTVAVIMSVYNEPLKYVKEAVDSILRQTFQDFEIIVVNDNPERLDYKTFFEAYHDERITFHQNEMNLSLAGAMNVAASLTDARLLARMDADDIAESDRLEKEVKILNSGEYDLVFSRYSYIDEDSKPCLKDKQILHYPPEQLMGALIERPIIHHPTVMMTADILHKVGGYRKLEAAEDYDLWLRMIYARCRFYMIEDALLKYRINSRSISNQKWQRQMLTIFYIERLFIERLKFGVDSYSEGRCEEFLISNGLGNHKEKDKLLFAKTLISNGLRYRQNGSLLKSFLCRMIVFIYSKPYREYYLNRLKKIKLLKRYFRKQTL